MKTRSGLTFLVAHSSQSHKVDTYKNSIEDNIEDMTGNVIDHNNCISAQLKNLKDKIATLSKNLNCDLFLNVS